MALQFPQGYAQNYAAAQAAKGGGTQGFINRFAQNLSNIPQEMYDKKYDAEMGKYSEALMNAYQFNVEDWETTPLVNFNSLKNAGSAYFDWKNQLENERGPALKYAKDNKLLNPIAFKQKYDEQIAMLLPQIVAKLSEHAIDNKYDGTYEGQEEMRRLVSANPGLKELLVSAGYGQMTIGQGENAMPNPISDYLRTPETSEEQWAKIGPAASRFLENRLRPTWGGAGMTAAGIIGAPLIGSYAWPLAKKAGSLFAKGGGLTYPAGAAGFGLSKGVGVGAEKAAQKAGLGTKEQKLSKEAGEIVGTGVFQGLRSIMKNKGIPWAIKTLAKKKGAGWVARKMAGFIGKGTLGTVGGAMTGGAMTAAMAAWTAKDAYDIWNILNEEAKAQ